MIGGSIKYLFANNRRLWRLGQTDLLRRSIMEYLAITALGPYNPIAINDFFLLAAKNDCTIQNTYLSALGSEVALMTTVSGNWNNIAKLENSLPLMKEVFAINIRRTKPPTLPEDLLPYSVKIVSINQPSVAFETINFFVRQNIHIMEMQTHNYITQLTGTAMISLKMRIGVPIDFSIADFREQFILLCDDMNLDGTVEPE